MAASDPVSAPRMPAASTDLLHGRELVPGADGGRAGVWAEVRLPSYRSLPLSCVVDVEVRIDGGAPITSEALALRLDGVTRRIAELRPLRDVVWWVLDVAELFIPLEHPLAAGEHELSAWVDLLTPYATVGRSVHRHASVATLRLAEAGAEAAR